MPEREGVIVVSNISDVKEGIIFDCADIFSDYREFSEWMLQKTGESDLKVEGSDPIACLVLFQIATQIASTSLVEMSISAPFVWKGSSASVERIAKFFSRVGSCQVKVMLGRNVTLSMTPEETAVQAPGPTEIEILYNGHVDPAEVVVALEGVGDEVGMEVGVNSSGPRVMAELCLYGIDNTFIPGNDEIGGIM